MESKKPSKVHIYQNITNNINVSPKKTITKKGKATKSSKANKNVSRELYEGDTDIYESVCDTVKQVLEKKGKFNFNGIPDKKFDTKPLYTYMNGNMYFGQWDPKTNEKHGQGIYLYSTGEIYEGYFEFGLEHGRGRHIYKCGSYYIGEYYYGKKHGQGLYVYGGGSKLSGGTYKGQYKRNK